MIKKVAGTVLIVLGIGLGIADYHAVSMGSSLLWQEHEGHGRLFGASLALVPLMIVFGIVLLLRRNVTAYDRIMDGVLSPPASAVLHEDFGVGFEDSTAPRTLPKSSASWKNPNVLNNSTSKNAASKTGK